MSLLNDARADLAAEEQAEKIAENAGFDDDIYNDAAGSAPGLNIDFSFLRAETGPGPIEAYIDHPLNASGSRGVAQILRGFTGLCGALNLAVIDITLGTLETIKEKRAEHAPASDI